MPHGGYNLIPRPDVTALFVASRPCTRSPHTHAHTNTQTMIHFISVCHSTTANALTTQRFSLSESVIQFLVPPLFSLSTLLGVGQSTFNLSFSLPFSLSAHHPLASSPGKLHFQILSASSTSGVRPRAVIRAGEAALLMLRRRRRKLWAPSGGQFYRGV